MLPWVCTLIHVDYITLKNAIRTSLTHSAVPYVPLSIIEIIEYNYCDLLLNSRAQLFEGQSELTQG